MAADGTGATPGLHGFSPALTSFVGRADAVRAATDLLGTSRLVTVVGPGGVGKTRLAGEVARQIVGPVTQTGSGWSNWPRSAIRARYRRPWPLRCRYLPGRACRHTEALAATLARQQMLLVLDNCEHVITAVAELCGTCTAGRGRYIRVLATSREPVGLRRGDSGTDCGRW